jgi:hypothetical protein
LFILKKLCSANFFFQHSQPIIRHASFGTFTTAYWSTSLNLWPDNWVLHGDNTHTTLGKTIILPKPYATPVPEHAVLNLGTRDFFMLPKIKMSLKMSEYESLEDIQSNVTTVLERLSEGHVQQFHRHNTMGSMLDVVLQAL